jgi:hypothetical protein
MLICENVRRYILVQVVRRLAPMLSFGSYLFSIYLI